MIAKSSIVLDVKSWGDETDMKEMENAVRSIQMDGLVWGACKLSYVEHAVSTGYKVEPCKINLVYFFSETRPRGLRYKQVTNNVRDRGRKSVGGLVDRTDSRIRGLSSIGRHRIVQQDLNKQKQLITFNIGLININCLYIYIICYSLNTHPKNS